MSNRNANTVTANIDFDNILNDLRSFLSYQKEFSDYDFKGSGLSVLLNALAYNTHYNLVYDNMALNESFLDSAVKRGSVVSHASMLGYVPRSAKASTAKVNVTVTLNNSNNVDILTIGANSLFTASLNGKTYKFYTNSVHNANRNSNGTYEFTDVELVEGVLYSLEQVYRGSYYETFKLKGNNIDTSTITVKVRENEDSTNEVVYTRAENILQIDNESTVYFLKESPDGTYEIQFGTGMLGKSLVTGNVVNIQYFTCSADEPNGIGVFTYQGDMPSGAVVKVSCTERANGGMTAESIDEIRNNAPRNFSTQNRCITTEDYKTVVLSHFSNAKSVKAWGGQDETPPQYGKVFISVIPKGDSPTLSDSEKENILTNIINPRKPLTTAVEVVDASLIRLKLTSTVYYKKNSTTYNKSDIENVVRNTILKFGDDNLGNFGDMFRFSKLSANIDNSDKSILNNSTRVELVVDITPKFGSEETYSINISNPIYRSESPLESVISSGFYHYTLPNRVCYIDDDPTTGTLRLFTKSDTNEKVILKSIGTIDYQRGTLVIQDLNIISLVGSELTFRVKPLSNDVSSSRSQFIKIDESLLDINVVENSGSDNFSHVAIQ